MGKFSTTVATTATPELLDASSAAAFLNLTPSTLAVWRCTGRHNLPYIKIGRNVRYSRKALQEWLDSRTHNGGA